MPKLTKAKLRTALAKWADKATYDDLKEIIISHGVPVPEWSEFMLTLIPPKE